MELVSLPTSDDMGENIIQKHLRYCQGMGLRQSTVYQRGRALVRMRAHHPGRSLLSLSTEELEDRLFNIRSAEGRASELSHLRGFYRWALEREYTEHDPTAIIRRPRIDRRMPRPITEDGLWVALDGASERVRPWLLLAAFAGLRASEVARLDASDLHFSEPPHIVVRESKSRRDGVVAMHPWLRGQLLTMGLPLHGPLFRKYDGTGERVTPWLVSRLAAADMRANGIDATIHQLRHRFGTALYDATKDPRLTQEGLRHESPVSTAGYTLVHRADIAQGVALVPVPPLAA